jgi:hypothetical protein
MAIVDKQSSVSKVVEEGKVRFTFSQYRERERERERHVSMNQKTRADNNKRRSLVTMVMLTYGSI